MAKKVVASLRDKSGVKYAKLIQSVRNGINSIKVDEGFVGIHDGVRPFFTKTLIEKLFIEAWDQFNLWPLKMKNDEPIFRAYSMANHPFVFFFFLF